MLPAGSLYASALLSRGLALKAAPLPPQGGIAVSRWDTLGDFVERYLRRTLRADLIRVRYLRDIKRDTALPLNYATCTSMSMTTGYRYVDVWSKVNRQGQSSSSSI
jgi:hypothetical protein